MLAVVLLLVAVGTAVAGVRADASPGDDDTTRAVVLGLALVVVVGTAARVGRRRPSRDGRWWSVVALWPVVAWTWSGLVLGGASPAALALAIPLLAFYLWPYYAGALLLGVLAASVVAVLDR